MNTRRAARTALLLSIMTVCGAGSSLASPPGTAKDRPVEVCSESDQNAIEQSISGARTWTELQHACALSRPCDDGYIAEGLSDKVVELLAAWREPDHLVALMRRDKAFGACVIEHIDATVDGRQLITILQKTEQRCPPDVREFCEQIKTEAESALKRMGADDAQSSSGRVVARLDGTALRWVHAAEAVWDKAKLDPSKHEIVLTDHGDTVIVQLIPLEHQSTAGSVPGFEIELRKADSAVLRSNYVR